MRRPLTPGARAGLAAAGAAVCVGAWLVHEGTRTQAPPGPSAADAWQGASARPSSPAPAAASAAPTDAAPLGWSRPTRIRIPVIGVDAPVAEVGLGADGGPEPPSPTDRNLAGWYGGSVTPGSTGTSVVVGHVDTTAGRAVFYDLGALHRGNAIDLVRADGSTAVFTIDAVEVYGKADFPAARVYRSDGRPELRLITCGGGYTKATGYRGNVVVYAHLVRSGR
ncbi:class F sortase [Kitasatospora sp. NPDC059571]|uniref:class F sortase n=1 Tax=Kitasatospora sp. NPDC059571 TaxID=3346871 RepID=UPI003699FFD3